MIKKLLLTTALATSILPGTSFGVSDADFAGIRGTMASIKDAMTVAIYTAENTYEQQGGTGNTEIDLKAGDNKYIDTLKLQPGYIISLKFSTARGDASKFTDKKVPVTRALLGKEIKLVPIYENGDEVITSWECLTDADKDVQHFMGSAGTPEYNASFIREYTTMPQLSLCIYVSDLSVVVGDYIIDTAFNKSNYDAQSDNDYMYGTDANKESIGLKDAPNGQLHHPAYIFIIEENDITLYAPDAISSKSKNINSIKADLQNIVDDYRAINTTISLGGGSNIISIAHETIPADLKNEFNAYFKWLSEHP